jgi:hypothetical protein
MTFPFFGALLGFFGGFAFAPTTYFVSTHMLPSFQIPCNKVSFAGIGLELMEGCGMFWQLPCIMWLCIVKPKRFGFSWCLNWAIIVLGTLLMVVSSIGGLRAIIVSASTFVFYE